MNVDRIVEALTRAANPDSDIYRAAQSKASRLPLELATTFLLHEASTLVRDALALEEEFRTGAGFMVRRDNGASGFYADQAAFALLSRTLRSGNAREAVDWLTKVLSTKVAAGTGVMALRGVTVMAPCKLTPAITLLPITALPESGTKAWLLRPRDPSAVSGPPWFPMPPPQAALMASQTVEPFLHDNRKGELPPQKDPLRLYSLLDEARLALTLIGPSAPLNSGYWFQFDDPDLAEAASTGGIMTSNVEVMPWVFGEDTLIDSAVASPLVSRYMSIDGSLRDRLRIAISRLNQALRRAPTGDKAIDLCIALEALLVDGGGENTHKVGLRAALVVSGTPEDRLQLRAVVGATYTMRSAILHSGVLPVEVSLAGGGKKPSHEVLRDAGLACAKVIRAIVDRGSVPDWYLFELSPGSAGGV